MKQRIVTNQEAFWEGEFGDRYADRIAGEEFIANAQVLFANILKRTGRVGSVLELGANIGLNIRALKTLLPGAELSGVEINAKALKILRTINGIEAHGASIHEFETDRQRDLVFTKTVLIHINPDMLESVYRKMHKISCRYILIAEYYNPTPISVTYRGHSGVLFKRDFAGEMLDLFDDLVLLDYGFVYHRDSYAQDDVTWFLMEKIFSENTQKQTK